MSAWVLGIASLGLALAFAPGGWLLVGLGVALFSATLSVLAWRRRSRSAVPRLAAAAGFTLSALALLVSGSRVALTLAALSRFEAAL